MKWVAAIVLVLAVLTGVVVWIIYPRIPNEVAICRDTIPGISTVGLKFGATSDGSITIDFGPSQQKDNPTSPEAYAAFVKCIQELNPKGVKIVRGVDIPQMQPIGAIANNWKGNDDLKLQLVGDEKELPTLNNLRIGPVVGKKEEVITYWCGQARMGKCVECTPPAPETTTPFVELKLRPNAPVKKIVMEGEWMNPKEPWELIENGKRYLYDCSAQ